MFYKYMALVNDRECPLAIVILQFAVNRKDQNTCVVTRRSYYGETCAEYMAQKLPYSFLP